MIDPPASAEVVTAPHRMIDTPNPPAVEPLHELVDLLRDAKQLGAVSYRDVTFICELVNHRRPEHLAAKKEVTPRTIRNHRDAIEHRLRIAVLTAA